MSPLIPFEETPRQGTERETLRSFLQQNRSVVLWKLDGIDEEAARTSPVGSGTTLLGVVKHLAWVERWWFVDFVGGTRLTYPWDGDDPDGEFRIAEGDTIDSVSALYATAVAEANAVIDAAADLDVTGGEGDKERSLRWVLIHMIEETARHAGHLDIVREVVDGSVGYLPGG